MGAYGQTGSGKTYSILGKKSDAGLLSLSLQHLIAHPNVAYVEISAIETFGHHIQKIRLFDLADASNKIQEWDKKKPMKSRELTRTYLLYCNCSSDTFPRR